MEVTVKLTKKEIDQLIYDYICKTVLFYAKKDEKKIRAMDPVIDQRDNSFNGYAVTIKLKDEDFLTTP